MKKKIIVTGGAGFIGAHTVVELINNNYEPIIIDDFRNSEHLIIDGIESITGFRPRLIEEDCANTSNLINELKNEEIYGLIHFAADKAVGESVLNPLKYYDNNIGSMVSILKLVNELKIKRFVFSSSCTVYGLKGEKLVSEKDPIEKALSPYGNTKIIGEEMLQDFSESVNFEFNAVVLRYFNPIGAHPSSLIGELPKGAPNNLVPFITQSVAGKRGEITVFGNDYNTADGTCVRDYMHVADLAEVHVLTMDYKESDSKIAAFNVGLGEGKSVAEIISLFEEVNQVKVNFKIGPRRLGDVDSIYASTEKLKKCLNWTNKYSISDALKHAWEWQKTLK